VLLQVLVIVQMFAPLSIVLWSGSDILRSAQLSIPDVHMLLLLLISKVLFLLFLDGWLGFLDVRAFAVPLRVVILPLLLLLQIMQLLIISSVFSLLFMF
jgi:hypothetical protein